LTGTAVIRSFFYFSEVEQKSSCSWLDAARVNSPASHNRGMQGDAIADCSAMVGKDTGSDGGLRNGEGVNNNKKMWATAATGAQKWLTEAEIPKIAARPGSRSVSKQPRPGNQKGHRGTQGHQPLALKTNGVAFRGRRKGGRTETSGTMHVQYTMYSTVPLTPLSRQRRGSSRSGDDNAGVNA